MPIAYSYLRFSSAEQAKGDSIRRQVETTAEWCRRNGVLLDESLSLRDEGVSAFRGKNQENPDVHGLACFLQAVKLRRVPPGSFLILENLDRLTRDKVIPALHLFTGILMDGIRVVQLRPHEQVFTENASSHEAMLAVLELSRGNSESVMKSDRVGKAWAQKRRQAATKIVTRRVPTWIDFDPARNRLVLNRDKAKVVRLMFKLAGRGWGLTMIARKLNKDGVRTFGRQKIATPGQAGKRKDEKERKPVVWSAALVHKILTSRATVGEYQPHRGRPGDRVPDGPPIRGYYPPVVDEATFRAARRTLEKNTTLNRGRRGRHVNLFARLLKDARSGRNLTAHYGPKREPVLFPAGATHGRGDKWVSFPLRAFETAILKELIEVQVDDSDRDALPVNKVEELSAQLTELDGLIAKWKAKMDRPELVDVVADKLAEFGREHKEVADRLADAKQEGVPRCRRPWGIFGPSGSRSPGITATRTGYGVARQSGGWWMKSGVASCPAAAGGSPWYRCSSVAVPTGSTGLSTGRR